MELKKTKVLVVIHNSCTWLEIKDILHEEIGDILLASSYEVALKKLESVLSIDVVLAEKSHIENTKNKFLLPFHANQKLSQIPIILMGQDFKENEVCEYAKLGVRNVCCLPLKKETLIEKIKQAKSYGRHSILVVEDEWAILEVLVEILKIERFFAIGAQTAEEGWKILGKEKVHLVITDILLPGMLGTVFLAMVKKEYNELPVIVITGCADRFGAEMAIEAGADAYLKKPFQSFELVRTIRKLLPIQQM